MEKVKAFLFCIMFAGQSFGQVDYTLPVGQDNLGECPECIKILYVSNTDKFNESVRKAHNIETLHLENTSIDKLPDYFASFKNLKSLVLNEIKIIPSNVQILKAIKSIDIVHCNDLNFDSILDSFPLLSKVKLAESENLTLSGIPAKYIIFLNATENMFMNDSISIENCTEIMFIAVNFKLIDKFSDTYNVRKMYVEHCSNINIESDFLRKFRKLSEIKILDPVQTN